MAQRCCPVRAGGLADAGPADLSVSVATIPREPSFVAECLQPVFDLLGRLGLDVGSDAGIALA